MRAWLGSTELELGQPRQRTVLAVLAFRAGQVVSRDELIDAVWGENPPASAGNGVHTYVKGVRRVLEPGRPARAPSRLLASDASGYQLQMAPCDLDATMFGEYLRRAREQRDAGDLAAAARCLDSALSLWRASPLLGLAGPWADTERARLRELRLSAIEERAEVMLASSRQAEVAAQLTALVRDHPLRERFHALLMTALYRCGRQAEALAVFAGARQVLVDELGIEPGTELRALHARILAADPALDATGPDGGPANETPGLPLDGHEGSAQEAPGNEPPAVAGQGAVPAARRPRPARRLQVAAVIACVAGAAALLAVLLSLPGPDHKARRPRAADPPTGPYTALIGADCPHPAGTTALSYDPAPPEWSVGTVGGFSGEGCYGEFFYQAQSRAATLGKNYVEWTARRIPPGHTRCTISIFIANSAHSAGTAHYYVSTLANGAPHLIGQRFINQPRHHGDWVAAGRYRVTGGWLRVDVHAQDPHRRDITADAINVNCLAD